MATRITRSQSQKLQIESSSLHECGLFNIIEVGHDGDCLFSSTLDFIEQNKTHVKDAPLNVQRIRSQTVEYILSRNSTGFQHNWDRFFGNIKFNLEARIEGFDQYGRDDKKDDMLKDEIRIVWNVQRTNSGSRTVWFYRLHFPT